MQRQLRHPHLQRQTQGLNPVLSQSSHTSGVAVPVQPSTSSEGDTGIEPGFSQSSHTNDLAAGAVVNTMTVQASISTEADTGTEPRFVPVYSYQWCSSWCCSKYNDSSGVGIMEADDRQVTTVFTVQPSFHHRHSTNRVT